MANNDDINLGESSQRTHPIDFGNAEPKAPDFDLNFADQFSDYSTASHDETPEIPPKPKTLGIPGGSRLVASAFSEIREIIPRELQLDQNWCVWIFEYHAASLRWKKRPFVPFRGSKAGVYPASAAKPGNWVKFGDAYCAVRNDREGRTEGIGRFFSAAAPFTGIDLDHCLDESGRLRSWAASILALFPGAYVEYSPSGQGLKLWTRAKLPGRGLKVGGFGPDGSGAIEIYDRDRYFTVTARPYGEPIKVIVDGSAAVLALYERLGGRVGDKSDPGKPDGGRPPVTPAGSTGVPIWNNPLADEVVIAKARATYSEWLMRRIW